MQSALIYYANIHYLLFLQLFVLSFSCRAFFQIYIKLFLGLVVYSFCREFQALSFDNKKGFNHRHNKEEILKILRGPFFLGHSLTAVVHK